MISCDSSILWTVLPMSPVLPVMTYLAMRFQYTLYHFIRVHDIDKVFSGIIRSDVLYDFGQPVQIIAIKMILGELICDVFWRVQTGQIVAEYFPFLVGEFFFSEEFPFPHFTDNFTQTFCQFRGLLCCGRQSSMCKRRFFYMTEAEGIINQSGIHEFIIIGRLFSEHHIESKHH